jgi:hypothetical protein
MEQQAATAVRRSRSKVVPFDTIKKTMQDEKVSMWQGEKGTYVFESVPVKVAGKPVAKVYLNRTYLSGLFKTKRPQEFSADVKEVDRRRYLTFRLTGQDTMDIFERVPVA